MPIVTVTVTAMNQEIVPSRTGKSIKVISFHYDLFPSAVFGFWWEDVGESDEGHYHGENLSQDNRQYGLVLGDKSTFIGPVGKALQAYWETANTIVTVEYAYM